MNRMRSRIIFFLSILIPGSSALDLYVFNRYSVVSGHEPKACGQHFYSVVVGVMMMIFSYPL